MIASIDISEKEWSDALVGTLGKPGLARQLGWGKGPGEGAAYHTLRSKGSDSGFPDWVLVRDRPIFLELKTEAGKVSPNQRIWISTLLKGGAEVYVVRPSHLEEIGYVLQSRHRIWPANEAGRLPSLMAELESVLAS